MKATDGSGLRKRQAGFAAVPNETVWDDVLPTRALGVLTKLIALPEDWDLRTDWLVEKCKPGGDGREAVMTALRHLRRLGYYRVERRRREGGTFVTGVSVSDVRIPAWAEQHAAACREQNTDKPKWDVTVRLLADGRLEDEPARKLLYAEPADPLAVNVQVEPGNGFTGSGRPGVRSTRSPVEPASGLPDVKEQTQIQTQIPLPSGEGAPASDAPTPAKKARRTGQQSRLSADWEPDEKLTAWTRENVPGMPRSELTRFRDFHTARGSLMADWDAAWRTWVGRWQDRTPAQRAGRPQPYTNDRWKDGSAGAGWDEFMTPTGGTTP